MSLPMVGSINQSKFWQTSRTLTVGVYCGRFTMGVNHRNLLQKFTAEGLLWVFNMGIYHWEFNVGVLPWEFTLAGLLQQFTALCLQWQVYHGRFTTEGMDWIRSIAIVCTGENSLFTTDCPQQPLIQWMITGNLMFEAYFEVLYLICVVDSHRPLKKHHYLSLVTIDWPQQKFIQWVLYPFWVIELYRSIIVYPQLPLIQ